MNAKQYLKEIQVPYHDGATLKILTNMIELAINESAWLSETQQKFVNDLIWNAHTEVWSTYSVVQRKHALPIAHYINSCQQ